MESLLKLEVDQRGFVSEEDRDEFFKKQFKTSENTKCFECGFNNPKWTSLSFSIYLCLNCSGKHRQLGSHISFVRSLDMDRFTRDQLVRMSLGGNGEFTAFLNSENLNKRPINYSNKKVLSYSAKLDEEQAKYTGKTKNKVKKEEKKELEENQEDKYGESLLQSDVTVLRERLESTDKTETVESSIRDDVEKLTKNKNEPFTDLLDFTSIETLDSKKYNNNQKNESNLLNEVKNKKDNLNLFEELKESQKDKNPYKFDSFADFINEEEVKLEKNSKDNVFNFDFVNSGSTFAKTESFSQFKGSEVGRKDGRGHKKKFSTKVNNFDFETFEKENKLNTSVTPHSAPEDAFIHSSSASSASPTTSAPGHQGAMSFGYNSVTSVTPSRTTSPAFQNVMSPQKGHLKHAAHSVVSLNTLSGTITPSGANVLLADNTFAPNIVQEDHYSKKVLSMPDLSKFEGKKAISSDAFFGTASPGSNTRKQVDPNSTSFSSDQYFGRPTQEMQLPTIEEQAIQNLNDLKENIVSAINKGGVLLEKAKNWLHTNYY